MDEVAPEYTADQNMVSVQTESRMEEMKTSLEEMKRETAWNPDFERKCRNLECAKNNAQIITPIY